MEYTITNLTEEGRLDSPQDGDRLQYTYSNGTVKIKVFREFPAPTQLEIESTAKLWRDNELENTDWMVPLTDHPSHSATLAYREALRNWPTTDDFPNTKPTL